MSQWKASVTFPCPFSAFATRCFPTLEQSRGGGGEAWIPSGHQLEGWSCLPTAQEAPGWGWGSLPWDSLGFGWMSSAGTLCSSTALSTHSSFPMLRGPKCLWAHPSLCTEHGPFVRAHTPHSLVAGGCSVPEGFTSLHCSLLTCSSLIMECWVLHFFRSQALPSRGETSPGALCTQRATSAALTLQIYSKIAEILPTAAFPTIGSCWAFVMTHQVSCPIPWLIIQFSSPVSISNLSSDYLPRKIPSLASFLTPLDLDTFLNGLSSPW